MANLKISELPAATALAGTESFPLVQGSTTKRRTVDEALADCKVTKYIENGDGTVSFTGPGEVEVEYLQANIIPRRDTLTNLLNNTAGGLGEISAATDWDALVLHNGVIGGAKILHCKPKQVQVARYTTQSIQTAVNTKMVFSAADAGFENTDIWTETFPDTFNIPAGANRCSVNAYFSFNANATGLREVSIGNDVIVIQSISKAAGQIPMVYLNGYTVINLDGSITTVSILAYQSSGANLSVGNIPVPRVMVSFWVA